jgi:outer membrane protein assembly factor BamB
LWEAKVGEGYASVAVSKGRVFAFFQDGEDETLVAWNAETGKELWRFGFPCRYMNNFGNGPRSTPTVEDDFIYILGAKGTLHCVKIDDGKPVWKKELLEEFGAKNLEWGVSYSPLVEGDRLFVMPGGPNGQALVALDKKTGAVLWQKYDDPASYASPTPATLVGVRQILFLTGSRLVSVVPETGAELWSYPWPIQQQANIASPLVVEEYVFLSSFYGKGCAVIKAEKSGDHWQPSLVYKNKRMRNHIATSVRHGDYLYGFDDKRLKCMNFRTGEVMWEQEGFDKGSVVGFGDHLIIYGANGILALAEANPKEYVEKASFESSQQGRSCWSVPVLANGRLYVRDQERLVCLDVRAKSR